MSRSEYQKLVALAGLEHEFDHVNNSFFKGMLPRVPIKGMKKGSCSYGWLRWKNKRKEGKKVAYGFFITINLERDWRDMVDTLRHEMAHLACHMKGVSHSDGSHEFAMFCGLLGVGHTIYKGRHAAHKKR